MLGSIPRMMLLLQGVVNSPTTQTLSEKTLESFRDFRCLTNYLDVPADESLTMKDALAKYSDLAKENANIHIKDEGYRITSDVNTRGERKISFKKNNRKYYLIANKHPDIEIEVPAKEIAEEISKSDEYFLSEGVKQLVISERARIKIHTVYVSQEEHDKICHPDHNDDDIDPPSHVHYAVPVNREL